MRKVLSRFAKTKTATKILVIAAGIVVLGAAGIGYAQYNNSKKDTPPATAQADNSQSPGTINYNPPTEEEKREASQKKEEIIQKQENPPPTSPATATLVRVGQSGKGQPLNVRVDVGGTTSGTCQVTLTKSGSATVSKSFPVGVSGASASCEGADIAASEFGADGEWNLEVIVKTGSSQSVPATQVTTIQR